MDAFEALAKHFERFPGIGPRQAGRFVQFLLRASPSYRKKLSENIRALAQSVKQCEECMRYSAGNSSICSYCKDPARDQNTIAVVASDADLAALERSGFRGLYFVLGGTISLATECKDGLRLSELHRRIETSTKLEEVILALPAIPEGDFTASYIRSELKPETAKREFRITSLGRGLSTGSELEYADQATIRSAIETRL